MLQSYDLSGPLPTIPTPHDCVIRRICTEGDDLVLAFEDRITDHDSARYYCPTARSLTVRFHLLEREFSLYKENRRRPPREGTSSFTALDGDALFRLPDGTWKLEYLYHYVAYRSMILVLWAGREYRLELPAVDRVELNWIE